MSRYHRTAALALALSVAVFSNRVAAQQGASSNAPIRFASARMIELPYTSVLGLPFVQLTVNGSRPLWFLLDTGFEGCVIDAAIAKQLGLTVHDAKPMAVPGGTVEIGTVRNATLALPGVSYRAASMQAAPLGGLNPLIGHEMQGIIGHDFLERVVMRIDYGAHTLRISDPASATFPTSAPIALTFEENQPFATIVVTTTSGRVVRGKGKLDTGSTDVAGFNANFVTANRLAPPPSSRAPMPGAAMGGETQGYLFRIASLRIGGAEVRRPIVGVTTDSKGFENRADAGTVGAGFLSHYRVTLDYPHRRMWLEPLAPGPAVARFDQSGLLLEAPGAGFAEKRVKFVLRGSAAAEAGIAAGDKLVSLDGRPASAMTISEIWSVLRGEGTHAVEIEHGGVRRRVTLALRPLLP